MIEYSVLIIDDDIWMQRILTKTFQSYGFKNVYLASNGFDGIALAVEKLPTLIVLDILMPELSGHITLKILKHIKITAEIPVLMVSALSDVENLGLAVKWGTAGFISKPFTRITVYEKLVSIFGKEELEMIAKGEPITSDNRYFQQHYANQNDEQEDVTQVLSKNEKEAIKPLKPIVTQDQLLQHYQEDEKKSIESIKKLLLKTKK